MNRRLIVVGIVALSAIALGAILLVPNLLNDKASQASTPRPSPSPTPPQAVRIEIQVRDAETRAPVAGAQVRTDEVQAITDQDGVCAFDVANEMTHTLSIQAVRYLDRELQVEVRLARPETLAVDVALAPNSAIGKVVGHNDRPLVDAILTLNGQIVPLDATGGFVLRRVAQGDAIAVTHPGYARYETTLAQTPLHIPLTPLTATISVFDAMTGQTVEAAQVCVDKACVSTDAKGEVVIHEVIPDIALSVQRSGYQAATPGYDGQASLRVELAPRVLTGVIRNVETGQPLTNTVLLVNGEIAPIDANGRYTLPDVTQVYTLFVKTPGFTRVTIPFGPETKTSRYDSLDPCLEPGDLPCADINLTPFAVHGIYINFNLLMWGRNQIITLIDMVDRSPILNAIVIDVKSDRGYVALDSDHLPENVRSTPQLPLQEFIRLCKERHIYTVARMVIFKDNELINARPELAVRHPNGEIFYDREGMAWGDPTRQEVWDYNILVSKEMIRLGFDEIQYDYLRYPSDSTSLAVVRALVYSIPYSLESRIAAVAGFVQAAQATIDETPAFLSADIFGYGLVVAPEFDMRIGQRLIDIGPVADYICPMIYPSTFESGNLGLASPSDEPYKVIDISLSYGLARVPTAVFRPWLQHYWYDRFEIAEQRRAAEAINDGGWCYWNAGAKYDELFFVPPEGLRP
ncbi:MAG: hypothetical protein JW934_23065 [Anaerolineae bacterium]|nr:hypothetical protein [Anaerolineae bacterium]